MSRTSRVFIVLALGVIGLVPASAAAQTSIVGSKHDLSTAATPEPCVFCHTPHGASTTLNVPLWNRRNDVTTFTPYTSKSMDTQCPATPSAYSLACLSCHDGVNISGAMNSKHDLIVGPGGTVPDTTSNPECARCHPEYYGGPEVRWIGTDLRNDHPISMTYPTPAQDPDFLTPPDLQKGWGPLAGDVKLFNGKVECPTCHNVHNPSVKPFLRKSNANDGLCKTCHIK